MADFDLPEQPGAARDSAILSHATAGDLDVQWVPLTVDRIELLVTPDAVKLGGVRINVSASVQQQLADALGALLMTPKILDLHYAARSVTIPPLPMPISSTSTAMKQESAKMDAAIAAAGGVEQGGIVGTVGKQWVLTNALLTHSGMACNYGWIVPKDTKSPWQGVAVYPSVTLGAMVIQQPSFQHDTAHSDYSQQCCLVHRQCKVDGKVEDLASVLTDATLAPLISHEGPITVPGLRQPGVALFSCPAPSTVTAARRAELAIPAGMCPTPPLPKNIVQAAGWLARDWPWVLAGVLGLGAIGFGAWQLRRLRS